MNLACQRFNVSFKTPMLYPNSEKVAEVVEGSKNVAVEVPKSKTTRKPTMVKMYEYQKCHRCFAYAACGNSHQEKCGLQTQPIKEPVRGKKAKQSMDEDWPSAQKLKPLKCKKDQMPGKNKAFLMNHQNLHSPPPYSATYKRKLYIPLCPRAISWRRRWSRENHVNLSF